MNRILGYGFSLGCGALPALAAFACFFPPRQRRLADQRLSSSAWREGMLALFWMFCGGMALLTLTPRWVVWSLIDCLHGYRWNVGGYPFFERGTMNLKPFQTFRFDTYILAGNIIMFTPFGFFAALLWRGYTWRRALLTGVCITGFIECWQLCVGRAFDIDDLLFNTLGVLCGFWIWLGLRRLAPDFVRAFHVRPCKE